MTSCRTRLLVLLVTVPLLLLAGLWQARDTFASQILPQFRIKSYDGPFAFLRDPPFAFAFGDSYTSEGWNGHDDPLKEYPLNTTANGPVWARHLQRSYSHALLVNFAYRGATIFKDLVSWNRSIPDVQNQVEAFQQALVPAPSRLQWHSHNALFMLGIGTNDVLITTTEPPKRFKDLKLTPHDAFKEELQFFFVSVGHLYKAGARAFVFNKLGPFDRAEVGSDIGDARSQLKENIVTYNQVLEHAVHAFCSKHTDTFCLLHDTYNLTATVMDNYGSFGFKEPSKYCAAYRSNAEVPSEVNNTVLPSCNWTAGEYVWRDRLHPSWHFHKIWADDIRKQINLKLDSMAT